MKPDIDARSLSSSLGLAVRIAQRMGLHDESTYGRCSVLEAELRRRLWWSLVIFDNRMCEMSNCLKATLLLPTWDCRVPSNVNDFDLRVETKTIPRVGDAPGQAIFAAVRSQIADYVRHSHWYLNFNTPALKTLSRKNQPAQDVFEEYIEEQYLGKCNPEDPLHAMTIWTARGLLAKKPHVGPLVQIPAALDPPNRLRARYWSLPCPSHHRVRYKAVLINSYQTLPVVYQNLLLLPGIHPHRAGLAEAAIVSACAESLGGDE